MYATSYNFPTNVMLAESPHTFETRQRLPDLTEFGWPKGDYANIPAGVNGSEQIPFEPKYSAGQRRVQSLLLRKFIDFMEEYGFSNRWFIYGGSLLGSFRHHDQIPWDDDMDILIDSEVQNVIYREFERKYPPLLLFKSGKRDKICTKLIKPPNITVDIEGSRQLTTYSWGWPFLDLSYYVQNNTHLTEIAESYGRQYIFKIHDIFPLIFRPYGKLWVPSPRNTFNVLKEMYPTSPNCIESTYSHLYEAQKTGKSINCEELSHRYCFVQRIPMFKNFNKSLDENKLDWILELLIRYTNNTYSQIIHEIRLVAPRSEARVDTYSLILKND